MPPLTTFTTWSALYAEMLNVSARFFTGQMSAAEYEITTGSGSRRLKYRTVDEFKAGLSFVREMAALEAAGVSAVPQPAVGRTYAKNGGGGRW